MDRRAAIAGVLTLAVVIAGCQFIGSGSEVDSPNDGVTETPSAISGPFDGASTPPGVDRTGVVDVDALMGAHVSALDGSPSTVAVDFHLSVNGSDQNVSLIGKTSPEADRGWIEAELPDGVGTYYTEDGTTYYREVVDGSARYGTTDQVSAIPQETRFGADDRIRTAIESAEWEPAGTVERDGLALLELRATSVDPPDVNASDDETVVSDGRLLVDADGAVHHVAVSTTVEGKHETVRYGLTVTLSDVGTTTIERPEWYDNAS